MRSGMNLLGAGLIVAAILVYLVLMAQFRSFVDPLIIRLAPRQAALAAAQVRLRPILMTSLTLVASMLPLSFSWHQAMRT